MANHEGNKISVVMKAFPYTETHLKFQNGNCMKKGQTYGVYIVKKKK
jgi:hypothetical protein